jgi:molybdopterin-guanine dinucleotide biosynthesis protein MobB
MATGPPHLPVLGFVAYSGTGKTTLLTQLIPALAELGIRVALIKHAHHGFDPDVPGKDSYRLRQAGAIQTLVASPRRQALVTELAEEHAPRLEELLAQLDPDRSDLVLVEGFRGESIPKIEVHRAQLGHPPRHPELPNVIALASDAPVTEANHSLPVLDLNRPAAVAEFIAERLHAGGLAVAPRPAAN